jgi:hypothetical protein
LARPAVAAKLENAENALKPGKNRAQDRQNRWSFVLAREFPWIKRVNAARFMIAQRLCCAMQ